IHATLDYQLGWAKKRPSLIPLCEFVGAGGTGAACYVALFNPRVRWDRKNKSLGTNWDPREQCKFCLVNVDHSKLMKVPTATPQISPLTCL
uniref:Cytochrome c oxidase subunit NDUFA4 n=1 Tax=Peromyscus maniculatus bairdii TaxID=230844 RepID=A0A8C8W227_PERMB